MSAPVDSRAIEVGLNAAIVAISGADPLVLVTPPASPNEADALPFGPFDPVCHRTFETGLRSWVGEQTTLSLGYVEQLYTFGDRGRHMRLGDRDPHIVSVGYLALTRITPELEPMLREAGARWRSWYRYFPWEDWREGKPSVIEEAILPALRDWLADPSPSEALGRLPPRRTRLQLAFGLNGMPWDEERVLDRYELLYEAGLVPEAVRDGRFGRIRSDERLGIPMQFDHRRILATAIARLRSKLKYRPVIFELLSAEFTLTELQRIVEAISGRHLHKQNFRRFVANTLLVEPTGGISTGTGGRPAALFRFREEVLRERPSPGIRVGRS